MTEQVFGIDLGTTYSAIAFINEFGQAEVIRNREGDETTPSVVYFESETNVVVGKEAKNETVVNRDSTVSLIKRHIGTSFTLDFFGRPFKPETISGIILKDLVDYAREAEGTPDTNKVVITVPAYFGLAEREATRQAGEIAGLEVVGIVTEPVAAALSVGITGEQERTLFVYDLGGGTFDCTIMTLGLGSIDVVVIDGNRQLGGADWDSRLFDLITEKFVAQAGLGDDDPTADEDFAQKLMTSVEECKKTLTRKERASIALSYGDVLEKVEVTRAEFEAATRTLVEETITIVKRTLAAAEQKRPGLTIDDVLLVGGSSRMPMIEASLTNELGWTLLKTELDLAVAKGAAVYGQGVLSFDDVARDDASPSSAPGEESETTSGTRNLLIDGKSVAISNVLSRALGVQYVRENAAYPGGWEPFVGFHANAQDSLPKDVTFGASIAQDGATEVTIRIFEQNSPVADEDPGANREVTPREGARLAGLPNLRAGSAIEFDLHISSEGLAQLNAFEPTSGQRTHMEVSLSVMQKEELEEAKAIVAGLQWRP